MTAANRQACPEPTKESVQAHLSCNWFAYEANRLLDTTRNRYGDFETTDPAQTTPNLSAAHTYATLALVAAVNDVTACIERYVGGNQ